MTPTKDELRGRWGDDWDVVRIGPSIADRHLTPLNTTHDRAKEAERLNLPTYRKMRLKVAGGHWVVIERTVANKRFRP